MPRRLTNQQTALLAAVERAGRPCFLTDLEGYYSSRSATVNALAALEERGLIQGFGNPDYVYVDGAVWWAGEASDDEWLEVAVRMRRTARLLTDASSHAGTVVRYLRWIARDLQTYRPGGALVNGGESR